jgi:hypothetical protein
MPERCRGASPIFPLVLACLVAALPLRDHNRLLSCFLGEKYFGQCRGGTCARFARAGLESRSHIKAIPDANWHLR